MTETSLGIKKLLLFCAVLLCSATVVTAWVPPIGIPYPPIGIDEARPPNPVSWPTAATVGYYYVNNAVSCTDTANTYGYPNNPRCTYPTTLAAGSKVTIAGGTYIGGAQTLNWVGTVGSPIWVMGPVCSTTQPLSITGLSLQREWDFHANAAYVIMECLRFHTPSAGTGIIRITEGRTHHIALRHTEFSGTGVVLNASSQIGISAVTFPTEFVHDIVLYNLHVHDIGDYTPGAAENDRIAVKAAMRCQNIWVLDSVIHHMGGDGLSGGDTNTALADRCHHLYYGRNTIHDNHENCIDVKRVDDIIISENTCYGFVATSSSAGEAIAIHDDPHRVWAIFNTVHDAQLCIATTSSDGTYFIGNIVYNCVVRGIDARGTATKVCIVNNTVYNADKCVTTTASMVPGIDVHNNILANCTTKTLELNDAGGQANSDFTYGVLGIGTVRIDWGDNVDRTVVGFQTQFSGEGTGLVEGDPLFVNVGGNDYHLQLSSPAIDAGVVHSAYSTFFSLYGLSIQVDKEGIARPQGPAWDIGAFEYQPANGGGGTPTYVYTFTGTFEAPHAGTTLTPSAMRVPIVVPVACTITAYAISVNPADTATFKVWKKATGTAIPTVSDSININGLSILSGTHLRSTTLTDFTTTAVAAYDMMIVQLSAVGGTPTAASLSVECIP